MRAEKPSGSPFLICRCFSPRTGLSGTRRIFSTPEATGSKAGLEIDALFRPTDLAGRPVYDTLFAAGSILAHQDWMRQKCGAGLAIATAYGAVKAFQKML